MYNYHMIQQLCTYSEVLKTGAKNSYVDTSSSSIIHSSQNVKQSKCPLADECINKVWSTQQCMYSRPSVSISFEPADCTPSFYVMDLSIQGFWCRWNQSPMDAKSPLYFMALSCTLKNG